MSRTEGLTRLTTLIGPNARPYELFRGHNVHIMEQLVVKSQEEEIKARCLRDAAERFSDVGAGFAWVTKGRLGRTMYPALNPYTDELDLILWQGDQPFPVNKYAGSADPDVLAEAAKMTDTYAIRAYESSRDPELGRSGVTKEFTMRAICDYFLQRQYGPKAIEGENFTGLHLEADADNVTALATYAHAGFTVVGQCFDPEINKMRTAMMLPAANIEPMFQRFTSS